MKSTYNEMAGLGQILVCAVMPVMADISKNIKIKKRRKTYGKQICIERDILSWSGCN